MIITQNTDKKDQLLKVFSWLELAYNQEIIPTSEKFIKQLEKEKQKDFSEIYFPYTETKRVRRLWFKDKQNKACPPQYFNGSEWVNGSAVTSEWLPYRHADIIHAQDKIALIHEGEKATEYARNCGLISFCFMGAKSQDLEFLKHNLSWLKRNGLKGAIYIVDNDASGEKNADKIRKVAHQINFPLICIPTASLLYICNKGYDFADIANDLNHRYRLFDNKNERIKTYLEEVIEGNLEEFINDEVAKIQTIKISIDEAKEQLEELFQSKLDEADLIIQSQKIYSKLEAPMSKSDWKRLNDSLRKTFKKERAKLDLQLYIQTEDMFEKIALKQKIQATYGYTNSDFYTLVNHIEQLEKTPKKQLWTIKDLVEASQQRENWLIPSFLPQGELLLISALSKVGKSLLATEIANAVLTGGKFLDEQVQKGKVLYCFSDESSRDFGGRVMNLGLDLPQVLPEQDNLLGLSYFDIRNLKQLEQYLEDFRPQLVVLDSLTSISFGVKESENDAEFSRNIYKLKDLLQKYNTSAILIHHNNKQGGISGTERIRAACWGTAQLEMSNGTLVNEDEEGNETTQFTEDYRFLKLNNTRSTEPATYKLLLNPSQEWINKGIYEYCGETSDPTGEKREAVEKIYSHLLKSGLPLEPSEINQVLGLPSTTLYRALDKLSRSSKVQKRRSNSNPKSWVYQVIDDSNCQQNIPNRNSNSLVPLPFKKIDPPPHGNDGNDGNVIAENTDDKTSQLIPTLFPSKKVDGNGNNNGNEVGMTETIDNNSVQDSESQIPTVSRGGGVEKTENENEIKTEIEQETAYCESISFIGMKVRHYKFPEIEGVIQSEPKEFGLGFLVEVKWSRLRDDSFALEIENNWITALLSDEIDFKAWHKEKMNG